MTNPDRIEKEQTATLTLTVIPNQERKDGLEGVFSYLGIPCAVTTACRRTGRRAGQGTVARLLGSGPLSHGRARADEKPNGGASFAHTWSRQQGTTMRPLDGGMPSLGRARTPARADAAVFFPHGGDAGGGMKAQVGPCVRSHLCWALGILG